jgi:hypothetical protein
MVTNILDKVCVMKNELPSQTVQFEMVSSCIICLENMLRPFRHLLIIHVSILGIPRVHDVILE